MPGGTATGRAKKSTAARKAATRQETDLQTRIAQRAYQFYEQRGYAPGSADEDWFRAEREILGALIVSDNE